MAEEYQESEMSKIVKKLMDEEGFEFGEAVKEAMRRTRKDVAGGGNINYTGNMMRSNYAMGSEDIPEIEEQESIKLFPNPCRIRQNIEIQSNKEISAVEVFNLLGRTVLITDKQTFQLDQSGSYVLGIRYEDGTTTALRFTIL